MSFADTVANLRDCPGVLMTSIAARDGIAVQNWGGARGEIDEIIAEYSNFLREVSTANRELQLGDLEQVMVTAQRRQILVTSITPEYFLLVVMERDGNSGKARFASRVAAFRLREELS